MCRAVSEKWPESLGFSRFRAELPGARLVGQELDEIVRERFHEREIGERGRRGVGRRQFARGLPGLKACERVCLEIPVELGIADEAEAVRLFLKQAVNGRDRVADRMTPEDRNEAQRLAREWDAAHPREP